MFGWWFFTHRLLEVNDDEDGVDDDNNDDDDVDNDDAVNVFCVSTRFVLFCIPFILLLIEF